jgi:putative acetyltransferase
MIGPVISPTRPQDISELVEIWEASVRATHHFLSEDDIAFFKPLVRDEFIPMLHVDCARDKNGRICGFVGVTEGKIEMLFIDPASRGRGIGKILLQHAVDALGATEVDVNEQNEQAVGFYQHMGFVLQSRSELDGMGKPFPLLHLRLKR